MNMERLFKFLTEKSPRMRGFRMAHIDTIYSKIDTNTGNIRFVEFDHVRRHVLYENPIGNGCDETIVIAFIGAYGAERANNLHLSILRDKDDRFSMINMARTSRSISIGNSSGLSYSRK
jgi:hypothetical protein